MTSTNPPTQPIEEIQENAALSAAVELVAGLDGTYGKTWQQVADELDATAKDGERTYVDAGALAGLVRALDTAWLLP